MKKKDRSINLEDYEEEDGEIEDELGNFMKAAQANRNRNVWGDDKERADKAKARVEGKLFKYFSRLTVDINDDDNNNSIVSDLNYRSSKLAKGLDALDCLQKIQGIFKKFKDDINKEIFISVAKSNKIVKLKELLELCAKLEQDSLNNQEIDYNCIDEDRDLAYQCCHIILSFFEIKNRVLRKVLSTDVRTSTKGKETKEEARMRCENEISTKQNAIDQLSVLVQSKDLFCTEKCAKAVSAVYKEGWLASIDDIEAVNVRREKREYNDEIKKKIKTCLVFLRRLLEVDTVNSVSSQMDIIKTRSAHCKLVINFEIMLNSIPAICCDLMVYNEMTDNLKPNVYHDEWLVDIIYIIAAILRGHSVKDMHRSWREGFVMKNAKANTNLPQNTSKAAEANSKLRDLLKQDAEKRNSLLSNTRSGRSSAAYKIIKAPAQLTEEELIKNEADKPENEHKQVQEVKNIIITKLNTSEIVAQVQNKRNKKSLTFVSNNTRIPESYAQEADGPTSCAVVASIMDKLCSSGGLNRLAARVNKGKINDDGLIITDIDRGIDAELIYFQILATLLQYNRLKLEDQKRQHEKRQAVNPSMDGWEPDLSNVFYVLESITWRSALDCIEQLHLKKHYQEEYIPMMVYKELVCYLRLMLESSSEAHHEVAVSIMHRLFYVSSERQDPLPQMLRNWSPGTFERKHLNCLVELVHETMKTLEVARSRFESKNVDVKKKKKGLELDQKIAACIKHDHKEYFKRLVTNESVRMYSKLLSKYESNDININHYVYCFLQRICNYKLEQEYKTKPANSEEIEEEVGLGHLLFNIQTLDVFSQILNDSKVQNQKEMQPLLRLIRHVTRRFGEASNKNKLLFVESLFQHSRAHDFVILIDNIYEAPMYVSMAQDRKDRENQDREFIADDDEPVEREKGDIDYGDEFEDDMFRSVKRKKKEKRVKERREKKRKRTPWTDDEDDIVREQYELYKGSRSMFDMIRNDSKMISLGNNRSAKDIERRIIELKLNMDGYGGGNINNDDDDNNNDEDDNDGKDDDDDDDDDDESNKNKDDDIFFSDSENESNGNVKSKVSSASKESNSYSNSNIETILDVPIYDEPNSFESRLRDNWDQVSDDDMPNKKRSNSDKLSKKKKLQKKSSNKIDDIDNNSDIDDTVEPIENKENLPTKKRQIIDSDDEM